MRKTLLLAAAAGALALSAAAPASQAAPIGAVVAAQAGSVVLQGADRTRALADASAALNRLTAAKGRFSQVAPDGSTSGGDISIARPGRLRFEYDKPSPYTIVADGSTVAIEDRALKDVTRVPLRSTPLHYVLKKDVSLDKDARVTRVARVGADLHVTARDRTGEADGEITIVFSGPALSLTQWSITDGQNQTTRITLSDVKAVAKLDPRLFRLDAGRDPTSR